MHKSRSLTSAARINTCSGLQHCSGLAERPLSWHKAQPAAAAPAALYSEREKSLAGSWLTPSVWVQTLQPLCKGFDLSTFYFSNFKRLDIDGIPAWLTRTG